MFYRIFELVPEIALSIYCRSGNVLHLGKDKAKLKKTLEGGRCVKIWCSVLVTIIVMYAKGLYLTLVYGKINVIMLSTCLLSCLDNNN